MYPGGQEPIIFDQMSERGLHTIEDDLCETWVEDWAAVGLAELEALPRQARCFPRLSRNRRRLTPPAAFAASAGGNARRVNFEWLYRGTPGHPLHPPLTDATIGAYTFATIAAVLSKVGIAEQEAAQGWTLALIVGLIVTVPTALTGLADWIRIERGTALFRTATAHMIAMLLATAFFLVSIGAGYSDGIDGVLCRTAPSSSRSSAS